MCTVNHSRALNPGFSKSWGFWKPTQENKKTKPPLHTRGSLAFWTWGKSGEEKDAFHLCNLSTQSSWILHIQQWRKFDPWLTDLGEFLTFHTKLVSLVFQTHLWPAKHCWQLTLLNKRKIDIPHHAGDVPCVPPSAGEPETSFHFVLKSTLKQWIVRSFKTIHCWLMAVKSTAAQNWQLEKSYAVYEHFWIPLTAECFSVCLFFKDDRAQ